MDLGYDHQSKRSKSEDESEIFKNMGHLTEGPFKIGQKVQLNFFDAGILTDCYVEGICFDDTDIRSYTIRVETGTLEGRIDKKCPFRRDPDYDDPDTLIFNVEEIFIEPVGGWSK